MYMCNVVTCVIELKKKRDRKGEKQNCDSMELGFFIKFIFTLLVLYLVWKIGQFVTKYYQWVKITSKVSVFGPLHPIWGSFHLFNNAADFFRLGQQVIEKERSKLICYWNMFLFPSFLVCHPETAKCLLKSSAPKQVDAGGTYRLLLPWIGDGLLNSSGKKWERNRRLLTPAFHFDILKPYVEIYNRSTDIFLENLKPFAGTGKSVDIFPLVSLETLDTILRCAFSYHGDIQTEGDNHPYVAAVNGLAKSVMDRWMKPWLRLDFLYYLTEAGKEHKRLCDYVHEFSWNIINDRKKNLEKEGPPTKRHLDFLDILLTAKDDKGVGLSDEDIQAEVDTFMFEGHDTTASAISWAIYHLGKYPEEQETIYKELSDTLGKSNCVPWDKLQTLPRVTAFIKESMRMIAPVPGIGRLLTSPLELGGVTIPAGNNIDLSTHLIHHHPDFWPEHEKFQPERFLNEKITDRHPFSFVPFSAGSRNCIGQHFAMDEIKVVISRLVTRYKVSLVPGHNYEINPELVMRAKYGIKITLENRE